MAKLKIETTPNFSIIDIQNAYRKLKSYIYYDNFFIYLRQQVAEFESEETFEKKLEKLLAYLNTKSDLSKEKYFTDLLYQINYTVVPKSYKEDKVDEDFIITNKFSKDHYEIEQVNYLIDAPVEIHLIAILWILREGKALVKTYKKDNYAYSLEIDSTTDNVVDGLRLFKPYFEQYQKWRDKAIDAAQHFVEKDTDVLMISLDVKKYFYNINLNKDALSKDIVNNLSKDENKKNELLITPLLFDIHKAYQEKLILINGYTKEDILPIGLLSSGIIGNWYLKDLDEAIINNLSPAYYGRYVDDIVIVLSNTTVPPKEGKKWVFNKFFVDRKILKPKEDSLDNEANKDVANKDDCSKKNDITYTFINKPKIELQKNKTAIYAFGSKESKAVLDKFKKNIEKNSSAFWFLPEAKSVNDDFNESVYELTYSDTVNKIRSVQGIKQSKYGASIFLAKKIKLSLLSKKEKEDNTPEQILTFFKGRMNLEFNSIWEKALTYFVVNKDDQSFWFFVKETLSSIDKLEYSDIKLLDSLRNKKSEFDKVNEKELKVKLNTAILRIEEQIKQFEELLTDVKRKQGIFLKNCIALSTSLNPNFINDYLLERLKEVKYPWFTIDETNNLMIKYRQTNLFRHYFVIHPLLNFSNYQGNISFIDFNIDNYKGLSIENKKFKYSPRFIYLNELIHFHSFKRIYDITQKNSLENDDIFLHNQEGRTEETSYTFQENQVIEQSLEEYFQINYRLRNPQNYENRENKMILKEQNKLLSGYYKNLKTKNKSDSIVFDDILIGEKLKKPDKIKIAIANTIVKPSNIEASMLYDPNLTSERSEDIIHILNQAEKNKADFLVMPEVSIPYQWLPVIAEESRRKQRAIIGGLEHIRINNVCYNFLLTCLPVERNGIKDVIINLRLKNHYSPGESKVIRHNRKFIPKPFRFTYNKFRWKGVHFSVYNCYELADITHRALFRSDVDILFASEYNKDVNYFSNIADTISRDVHCYFVQVNSSDWGDSRITKPSKTESKDIMRLKGGKNSVVLYEEIDLKELRKFQSKTIDGQDTNLFKNTPPEYSHEKAQKRLTQK